MKDAWNARKFGSNKKAILYMIRYFKGSVSCDDIGYYAYIENDELVIGESRWREGGELYRGEYKGKKNTPWLTAIKSENLELYDNIVNYFGKNEKFSTTTMDYSEVVRKMCDGLNVMKDFEADCHYASSVDGKLLIKYKGTSFYVKLQEIENPSEFDVYHLNYVFNE